MPVLAHNLAAMNAQRQLGLTNVNKGKSTEKLSSGYRINRAADDAAGLAISEKMRRQVRGLTQGVNNTEEGVSVCQVADGALAEVNDMLHRITELSVKAANGTLSPEDRSYIQKEIDGLIREINRIGETTTFNEIKIFQGNDKLSIDVGGGVAGTKPSTDGEFFQLFGSDISKTGYMEEPLTPGDVTASTSPMGNGNPYVSVHMDMGVVTDFQKLVGTTFFANCCTNCCPVTVDFTDESGVTVKKDSIKIGVKKDDGSYFDNAEEFCKYIVEGTDVSTKASHVEFAYKGSTLFMYDVDNNAWSQGQKQSAIFCDSKEIFAPPAKQSGVGRAIWIHSGCEPGQGILLEIGNMNADILGVQNVNVTTIQGARDALDATKTALGKLSMSRSVIGAQQNRLEHTIANENNVIENIASAESRIRDTDVAKEIVELAKHNILAQAGTSILAQANQSVQSALSLLQ